MCALPVGTKCSVIGCNAIAIAKGLCDKHRKRLARHGTTDDSVGLIKIDGYAKLIHHPLYESWRNITRANNGQVVCERWKDFRNFIADVERKPDGAYRLIRIDKSRPYGPDNSRWADIVNTEEYREGRAEYMREYQRRLRAANPEHFWDKQLKKNYGISAEQYTQMINDQNGVCKICGQPETRRDKSGKLMRLHVDHCHSTHQVRGLLCHNCNVALGGFKDSIDNLQSAIKYLTEATLTPPKI